MSDDDDSMADEGAEEQDNYLTLAAVAGSDDPLLCHNTIPGWYFMAR